MSMMKPLHLLRGLYRQLKTPTQHVSMDLIPNNKNITKTATSVPEPVNTTNKSRSNTSTRFLIQQYRVAVSSALVPSSSSSSTDDPSSTTTTTTKPDVVHHKKMLHNNNQTQHLQQHRMAMEFYLLRRDIHQRGELYLIDAGADQQLSPKEFSRRAAARAGLQLPEQYNE